MWIRSQNKKTLINTSNFYVFGTCVNSSDEDFVLGQYDSEERALEVLDSIQSRIIRGHSRDYLDNKYRIFQSYVFEMPEK